AVDRRGDERDARAREFGFTDSPAALHFKVVEIDEAGVLVFHEILLQPFGEAHDNSSVPEQGPTRHGTACWYRPCLAWAAFRSWRLSVPRWTEGDPVLPGPQGDEELGRALDRRSPLSHDDV